MDTIKILAVDDSRKISRFVNLILSRLGGYDVREENSSSAVLKVAREYMPDLIILDLGMPKMDGDSVAAALRADPGLQHIPIMFLSGLVGKAEKGERNGSIYLAKPVNADVLLCSVKAALEAGRAAAAQKQQAQATSKTSGADGLQKARVLIAGLGRLGKDLGNCGLRLLQRDKTAVLQSADRGQS